MSEDTITPTEDEISTARSGIYLQLKERTKLVERFGSLACAIEECGLGDFIDNQTLVIARDRAWIRFMQNILHNGEHHV